MIANEVFKSFSEYMKYEGIEIKEADVAKLVDIYERIIIALTVGEVDNSLGISILFEGKQNIDFRLMNQTGIDSIKRFITEMNSNNASFPIFETTLNNILTGNNIVTVFKHIHNMLNTIFAFGREFVNRAGRSSGAMFSFLNKNDEDGTELSILGFETVDGNIIFKLESDSYVQTPPADCLKL